MFGMYKEDKNEIHFVSVDFPTLQKKVNDAFSDWKGMHPKGDYKLPSISEWIKMQGYRVVTIKPTLLTDPNRYFERN